jgi:DNA-directed RNA polymerase specialized sigma24 family protein
VLGRFADAGALIRFMRRPGAPIEKDAALRALLVWAREDPVGGRLVLEAVRPGFLHLLGRLSRGTRDREELRATLTAALWEGIRRYPVERRPRRVAANLLLDTLHRTVTALGRESEWRAVRSLAPPPGSGSLDSVDGDVDGLMERAVVAGALSAEEAELVLLTRVDGERLLELARRSGVAYNTLKVRRQRAERRLLVFLGFRPVPRGQQKRPSSFARVAGAGSKGPDG